MRGAASRGPEGPWSATRIWRYPWRPGYTKHGMPQQTQTRGALHSLSAAARSLLE